MKLKSHFLFLIFTIPLVFSNGFSQGKWEFNLHYGSWNVNFAKSAVESAIEDSVDSEIRDSVLEDHPDLTELNYNREFNFGSSGFNGGFEIRYYPGGEDGSFSIGFSIEKTKMKLSLDGTVNMDFTNGSYVDYITNGEFLMEPLSYNLSFRWDIKPSWVVHPYIGFGFGIAPLKGNFSFSTDGTFFDATTGTMERETNSEKKNLEDLEELPIKIIPILQFNFGIKGKITQNIHFHIDAGMWDGLLIRGGISLRI